MRYLNALKSCLVIFFIGASFAVGAENALEREAKEVHIPPLSRADQISWLMRQLRLNGIADVGCAWPVKADDGEILAPFDFKAGSVEKALNAYCSHSAMRWHPWKEAGGVWLEPKAEKSRLAERFLPRPIDLKDLLAERANWTADANVLNATSLSKAWSRTLKQPQEKSIHLSAGHSIRGGAYLRGVFETDVHIVLPGLQKGPRSVKEFVATWLAKDATRHVLIHADGDSVCLDWGSFTPPLHEAPAPDLVKTLLARLRGDPKKIAAHRDAAEELYRRLRTNPKPVVDELKRQKFLATVNYPSIFNSLGAFPGWLPDSFGRYVADEFSTLPVETQKNVVKWLDMEQPSERGKHFLEFWKQASQIDDPEIKKRAKFVLERYRKNHKL